MDLRRVFSRVSGNSTSKKSEKDSFFLAVKISSTSVLATVWTIDDGKVSIGEIGVAALAQKNYEHLLKSCDQAISQASVHTAPNVEKAIFAVPHSWVHDGKIVPEHLQTLRRICKELDLVPLGYVVTIEALENLYKEVEGAPLTAILIGIDEDRSVLTIFRAGRDLGTVPVAIDTSQESQIAPAIEAAIKRFSHIEALPSRIILYDSGRDLEPIAQKITAYPWTGKLPFLHFPKVEKAPAEFVIKAVAAAGGLQMGATLDAQDLAPSRLEHHTDPSPVDEVNTGKINDESESTVPPAELEEVSPEAAGFVTESEFGEINIPMTHNQELSDEFPQANFSEMAPPSADDSPSSLKHRKKLNLKSLINMLPKTATILGIFRPIISIIKKEKNADSRSIATSQPRKFPLIIPIIIAVFLVIFGLFAATTYFVPKANLLVTVDAKNFNHQMSVGITTSETQSPTQKAIPGSFVDSTELGTRKGPATGQKLVGTEAKGTVTIYGVGDSRKFAAETTLTAPNGLKFTLDSDSSVASGDAVTPSTAKVSIHAANIGDTYNLPAGTKFTIGNLSSSDYLAKNDSALTGGSSHQATVVTKLDQDRLMTSLSEQLLEQAKVALQAKLGPSQTLLPNAITSTVSKKKFTKDIDSESDSVSLDLTMDFRAIVFSKDDVIKLFSTEFSSEIPQGYSLTSQNTDIQVTDAQTDKNGNATLSVSANANLAPELNSMQIVNEVSGKDFKSAGNYISRLPGVSDVKLEVSPSFFEPVLQMFLPWKKDNLKVEVITK